jgi:hypothetical protein
MSAGQPDTIWSYQSGDWFGIFGAELTLLLPGTEKSRVTGLWELVDGGAGFDQVLDGLLSTGLSALSGFVLIGSAQGGPTRILLRGDSVRAAVDTADGPVALEGSITSTWSERVFEGVTSITVAAGDPEPDSRHLPIQQGLVRVSRIDRPEHSPQPVATTPEAMPEAVPEAVPDAVPEPDIVPVPEVVPDLVPEVFEESSPLDDDADADTNAQPSPYAAGLAEATGPIEPLPVSSQLPTLPPPPPLPPLAPVPVDPDHDGMTRAGLDPDEFAHRQPGIPGQPQPPSIVRSVAKLVISNGETVDVDRVVLVGRAPEARRFTSTEQPRLVTVQSPLHEISSTHVEVRPGAGADHGSAVVTDMGSTNGTVLVQPGLGPEELKPGIAVQLIPGAVINLGDGVTIQVARP